MLRLDRLVLVLAAAAFRRRLAPAIQIIPRNLVGLGLLLCLLLVTQLDDRLERPQSLTRLELFWLLGPLTSLRPSQLLPERALASRPRLLSAIDRGATPGSGIAMKCGAGSKKFVSSPA